MIRPTLAAAGIVWSPLALGALANHAGLYPTTLAIGAICAALTWRAMPHPYTPQPSTPAPPTPGPKPGGGQ